MADEKKKQEHEFWVREELQEAEREKKKAAQFYKSKIQRTGFRDKAKIEGMMIHGVKGKPGRTGRGNKR